ncbi:MAG TPA: hypothetical protein VMP11_07725 [Verrucomicrobiae bacterium]|nr:hypothetical protein [Verrucomicrobiae bacterium]
MELLQELVQQLVSLAQNFLDREPIVALVLAGAFVAAFFTAVLRPPDGEAPDKPRSPSQVVGRRVLQTGWAVILVAFLACAVVVMKRCLNRALENFRQTHGRVSETNYEAVQTIWGPEQSQQELTVQFGYDEEETERVEFDDPTKPAIIKKKTVHRTVPGNAFESARHEVTLRQNPRQKGSAIYPGYETQARFTYKLRYPGDKDARATIRFPLPSASMVANDLAVSLNGASALGQMEIKDSALVLEVDVQKGWTADLDISFKSRGVSFWYFQVSEPRVIRDFELTLHLPDLPKDKLNYPEGCMTPTEITPTADKRGCDLVYRLGDAVSTKGMGIALARPEQPGRVMDAVLAETPTAWTLVFSAMIFGLSLAGVRRAVLLDVLVGAAAVFAYGLLGNFHDIVFGFWGSVVVVLVPLFAVIAWTITRIVAGLPGKLLAVELVLFGILYPSVAGLDADRQMLYLNVCAAVLLVVTTWQLVRWTGARSAENCAAPAVA